MECRNAVINNPARIALIEKAKEFRLDRIGYFSREEEMADFALSVSGWTAINSEDDLPKKAGEYFFRNKHGYIEAFVNYDPQRLQGIKNAEYVAYMPIPPYEAKENL
jgi:hypothetical protein